MEAMEKLDKLPDGSVNCYTLADKSCVGYVRMDGDRVGYANLDASQAHTICMDCHTVDGCVCERGLPR